MAGLRPPGVPVHRPVPILSFHGTNDRINPYGGSGTQRWNESVPDAARAWALANGITGSAGGSRREPDAHPDDLRCAGAARRGDAVDVTRGRSHLARRASRAAAEPLPRPYVPGDRRHQVDLGVRAPPRRRSVTAASHSDRGRQAWISAALKKSCQVRRTLSNRETCGMRWSGLPRARRRAGTGRSPALVRIFAAIGGP